MRDIFIKYFKEVLLVIRTLINEFSNLQVQNYELRKTHRKFIEISDKFFPCFPAFRACI